MTRFKFCGITREEDARLAAELGASHVGVILAPGPRQVMPERARELFAAAPGAAGVGVVRHSAMGDLIALARVAGPEVLQLNGHFTAEEVNLLRAELDAELWAVFPMDTVAAALPDNWTELTDLTDAVVLDASVGGRSGGTGVAFDWMAARELAGDVAARTTLAVAGGLAPRNVADAIRLLRPDLVDVSSGVEVGPGVKDPALMRLFARHVLSASIE